MDKLECGFSQSIITPPVGEVYLDGYGHRVTPATGIRDDLYVKVCAMRSSDDLFVILSFDICGFNGELARRLRNFIKIFCGLDNSQFTVCATHTHAGPAAGILADLPMNFLYWNNVGEIAALTVKEAIKSLSRGYFDFAFGGELVSSFNRRGGKLIDRRVRAGAFFNEKGELKGVLSSAACHAVVCTDYNVSADYPAVLTREGAKKYPDVPILFLQGRGADIDPYFTNGITRDEMYEKLGNELASSVFTALDKMKKNENTDCTIKSIYKIINVPMSYPPLERLEKSLADFQNSLLSKNGYAEKRYPAREFIWHSDSIEALKTGKKPIITAPIQMAVINKQAVFVFVSFEILTRTGNTLEDMLAESGFGRESIFIIGYSNGTNGYLAPAGEFDNGGYEISGASHWYGLPECTVESEQTVISAIEEMSQELINRNGENKKI